MKPILRKYYVKTLTGYAIADADMHDAWTPGTSSYGLWEQAVVIKHIDDDLKFPSGVWHVDYTEDD